MYMHTCMYIDGLVQAHTHTHTPTLTILESIWPNTIDSLKSLLVSLVPTTEGSHYVHNVIIQELNVTTKH